MTKKKLMNEAAGLLGVPPPNLCYTAGNDATYLHKRFIEHVYKHNYDFIEITINHPRTKQFMCMSSHQQKRLYTKLLHSIPDLLNDVQIYAYVFETCGDGQIHLHGILQIPIELKYSIMGLLSDICKKIMNTSSIRQVFDCKLVYQQFRRIRQHCILVQFREECYDDQRERVIAFHLYMLKHLNDKH